VNDRIGEWNYVTDMFSLICKCFIWFWKNFTALSTKVQAKKPNALIFSQIKWLIRHWKESDASVSFLAKAIVMKWQVKATIRQASIRRKMFTLKFNMTRSNSKWSTITKNIKKFPIFCSIEKLTKFSQTHIFEPLLKVFVLAFTENPHTKQK